MIRYLLAFLSSLTTYGAVEVGESDKGFIGTDDDDDDDGETADTDDSADEGEADDTDDDTDEDDDSEDGDDDSESDEEGSDESGEGAGEEGAGPMPGASAFALEHAVKARLSVRKDSSDSDFELDIPTVEDLAAEFPDMHNDDLQGISRVAAAIVKKTISAYDNKRVGSVIKASTEAKRASELEAGVREFLTKYPDAFGESGVEDAMSAKYQELAAEFDVPTADSVSVEEYYLMVGGSAKPVRASGKGKQAAKAAAQKNSATRANARHGTIAKVKTGKQKRRKDEDLLAQTAKHIQQHHFNPFTMPTS